MGATAGTVEAQSARPTRINSGRNGSSTDRHSVTPRLLTLPSAARYVSLSASTVISLEESGVLKRVQVTVRGRTIRRRLYDKADLDELVMRWKA